MAMKESDLNYLVERVGSRYRARIERAVRWEEEKSIGKAMREWEGLVAQARKEGKDVSIIQSRLQRLHRVWWQMGRPGEERESEGGGPDAGPARADGGGAARPAVAAGDADRTGAFQELKNAFRLDLQKRCINQGVNLAADTEDNRRVIRGILDAVVRERLREIPDWVKRKELMEGIVADVLGLGAAEEYLADPSVTEVMINGRDVYYEREGRIFASVRRFESLAEVRKVIDRIVHPINRRVDESSPMVDARLPDGSRVNIVIPPVALDGPLITIRKFSPFTFSSDALVERGSFSPQMSLFFRLIVLHRQNIMVAGKTSSGKTTLLNIMGNHIPGNERIVTIEEMAELQLHQRHVARLEARPPNIQGRGAIEIRTLFRNALHMRPDRIIVGECRGAETLDMLQAMNTGHDGSISTAHANSPRDLFARLEAMVGMSEIRVSPHTVRAQVASGLDFVVYCSRLSDGSRKVTRVCEVTRNPDPAEPVSLEDVYVFEQRGVSETGQVQGTFGATGYVPTFVREQEALREDAAVMGLFRCEG